MKQEVKEITPEEAREILKKNTINRPLSRRNINFLTKEIEEGRWKTTHQGICIAKDGTLIDGQHRLQAIIKAGKSVKVLVTYNLDKDIFKFVDTGKRRSSEDIFSIEGFKYPKELPGLIKKIFCWTDHTYINTKESNHNIDVFLEFAVMNELDLYDAISRAWKNSKKIYSKSTASFMYWICRKSDVLLDLLDQLLSGKTVDPHLISLRDELIDLQVRRLTIDPHRLTSKTLHAFLCSLTNKKKRFPEITQTTPRDIYAEILTLI